MGTGLQVSWLPQCVAGHFQGKPLRHSGLDRGIVTSMQGDAQVDINFNHPSELQTGCLMEQSRQIINVTLNDFDFASVPNTGFNMILARPCSDSPDKTALTVSGNTFNVDTLGGVFSNNAIWAVGFGAGDASISLVVKENTFNMSESNSTGVSLTDISNAVIIDNRFFEGFPVSVFKFPASKSTDNAILAKRFERTNNQANEIFIGSGVDRTIVGPGQQAGVVDDCTDSVLTGSSKIGAEN